MDSLFGIPTDRLTFFFLVFFLAGATVLAFLAARDRTSLKMAVRNVPRRRAQAALIVAGITLATALFSAAFTTGDTLTNSLRAQALENIGRVDVVVKAEQPREDTGAAFGPGAGLTVTPEAREKYFDGSLTGKVRDRLSGDGNVSGVTPLAKESVPVTSPDSKLSEPRVDVLGMDASSMAGFDKLKTGSGKTLSVGDLGKNEVYVSRDTAEGLGVKAGDEIEASLVRPTQGSVGESSTAARGQPRLRDLDGHAARGAPEARWGRGQGQRGARHARRSRRRGGKIYRPHGGRHRAHLEG